MTEDPLCATISEWLRKHRDILHEMVGRLEFHIGPEGVVQPALYLFFRPIRTRQSPRKEDDVTPDEHGA